MTGTPQPGVTTFDTATGTANTLTLYQLDCGCADNILIVKDRAANELVLH